MPHALVCCTSGRQRVAAAGAYARASSFTTHQDPPTTGAIRACEHEVAKAGTPRLSLVYELRPSMEVGRALLERGDSVID